MASKLSDDDIRNILKGQFPREGFRLEDLQTTELRKLAKFMGQELKIKDIKALSREDLITEIRRVRPNIDKKIEEGDTGVALPAGAKKLEDLNVLALRKLISKYNKDIVIKNYQTLSKDVLINEIRKRVPMLEFKPEVQAPLRTALEPAGAKPEEVVPVITPSIEDRERARDIIEKVSKAPLESKRGGVGYAREVDKRRIRYLDEKRALEVYKDTKFDTQGEAYKELMINNSINFDPEELGHTEKLPTIASLGGFDGYSLKDYEADNKYFRKWFNQRIDSYKDDQEKDYRLTQPISRNEIIQGTLEEMRRYEDEYKGLLTSKTKMKYSGMYNFNSEPREVVQIKQGLLYPSPYRRVLVKEFGESDLTRKNISVIDRRGYLFDDEAKPSSLFKYSIVVGQTDEDPYPVALGRIYHRVDKEKIFMGLTKYPELPRIDIETILPIQKYSEEARKFIDLALVKGDARVVFVNPFNRRQISDLKYLVFNAQLGSLYADRYERKNVQKSYIYVLLAKGKGKVHIKGYEGGVYEIEYTHPYYPDKVENLIRPSDINKIQDFDDVNETLTKVYHNPWIKVFGGQIPGGMPKIYNYREDWLAKRGKDFWGSDFTHQAFNLSLGGFGISMLMYQNQIKENQGVIIVRRLFAPAFGTGWDHMLDLKGRDAKFTSKGLDTFLEKADGYKLSLTTSRTDKIKRGFDIEVQLGDFIISGLKGLIDFKSYEESSGNYDRDENFRRGRKQKGLLVRGQFTNNDLVSREHGSDNILDDTHEEFTENPLSAVENNWGRLVEVVNKIIKFNSTPEAEVMRIERTPPEFGFTDNHPNPNYRTSVEEIDYLKPPSFSPEVVQETSFFPLTEVKERTPTPEPSPEPVVVDIETGRGLTPEPDTEEEETDEDEESVSLEPGEYKKGQATVPVWREADVETGGWWRRGYGNDDDPGQDIDSISSDKKGTFKTKKLDSGRVRYTYYLEERDYLGEIESRRKAGIGIG